jgi:hypothetical protein
MNTSLTRSKHLTMTYWMHLDYHCSFIREPRANNMTFEYNPYSKTNNDFIAVSIKDSSVSYPPSSKLYCNLCSCNLVLVDLQTEEWFCNRCHVSYFPSKGEKVKRPSKFEAPGPETRRIVGDF